MPYAAFSLDHFKVEGSARLSLVFGASLYLVWFPNWELVRQVRPRNTLEARRLHQLRESLGFLPRMLPFLLLMVFDC